MNQEQQKQEMTDESKDPFWIGQQGDQEEDCYHKEDSHYYIGLPEHWTLEQSKLFLDIVMSIDKKLTRISKENKI